jgi:hypothetical protein
MRLPLCSYALNGANLGFAGVGSPPDACGGTTAVASSIGAAPSRVAFASAPFGARTMLLAVLACAGWMRGHDAGKTFPAVSRLGPSRELR